jgi:hypothetical protein
MKFGGFSLTLGAAAAFALLITGGSSVMAGPDQDHDGDAVDNVWDNCMAVANGVTVAGVQRDDDRDGWGNKCDSDYDQSGAVNLTDFGIFVAAYGESYPSAGYDNLPDQDSSGAVNLTDFGLFVTGYGIGTPGPSAYHCAKNPAPAAPTNENAPNLTGYIPCAWMVTTYRVKCQAGSDYGLGKISDANTGVNLRFIQNDFIRSGYEGIGPTYGHCDL